MKILSVTFHKSQNYGAALQTYALQQALMSLGYDTAVVDYQRMVPPAKSMNAVACLKQGAMAILERIHRKDRELLKQNFNSFISENVKLTPKYDTYEELESNPPEADMYLLGSDQVWNVTYRYRPEFFADYAKANVKVASYAASIGHYRYRAEQLEQLRAGLKKVSPISVREESACAFLKENFDLDAQVHLDPVFLLKKEEWKKLAVEPCIKGKYILCYALTHSRVLNEAAKKLKKETEYKVVSISASAINFTKGDINIFNAGPKEFLGLIFGAEIVLTTSFHGTALSIIAEKPFYNFTAAFYASRTSDLITKLELTDRIPTSVEKIVMEKIDYTKVSEKIEHCVQNAKEYLNSLKEV